MTQISATFHSHEGDLKVLDMILKDDELGSERLIT